MGNLFPFKLLNEKVRKNIKFDRKVLLMVESGENCPTVFFSWGWLLMMIQSSAVKNHHFLVSFLACFGTKNTRRNATTREAVHSAWLSEIDFSQVWNGSSVLLLNPKWLHTEKNIRWRLQSAILLLFSVIDRQQATTKTSWLPANKQGKQQGVGFCHHLNL